MILDYQSLLDNVKEFDKICIYRHVRPDGDAVGSQLGLRQWINDNFPTKEVKIMGLETFDTYPYIDEVDDEFIKNSLGIILDCSNTARIDDERYINSLKIIRYDHHPLVEEFGDGWLIETQKASTCELLATIFFEETYKDYKVTKECAEYLYSGMLTDTLNFKTVNCSAHTLHMAAKLADTGINISDLSVRMFDMSQERYQIRTKVRNYYRYEDGLCYVYLKENDLKEIGIDSSVAKICVSEFSSVRDFKIWCIIAYNAEDRMFEGSLRSKKGYIINDIAQNHGGGGHPNASGIRYMSENDVENLISELKQRISEVESAQKAFK